MSKAIILVLLCCTIRANGQQFSQKDLIGVWKVLDAKVVENIPAFHRDATFKARKRFIGSIMVFQQNGHYSQSDTDYRPELKDAHWEFKKTIGADGKTVESSVIITRKDGSYFMSISVTVRKGNTYFLLEETPFLLAVKKQ